MNARELISQAQVYRYGERLLAKFPDLAQRFARDTVVPDQVEIHLPPAGPRLCWLDCPHCFTHCGRDGPHDAIALDRLLDLVGQIGTGHPGTGERPEKIILAGFNTDPLNSPYVGAVARRVKECGFMLGVHTKGLRIPSDFADALMLAGNRGDYLSFSVDAGSDAVFNAAHGIQGSAHIYTRIKSNIAMLVRRKRTAGAEFKLIATYLITEHNALVEEIQAFVEDMFGLGVDHLRLSEPIKPVMGSEDRSSVTFPEVSTQTSSRIREFVESLRADHPDKIHYLDFPATPLRVLPCYARWMVPTIGYDGFLYPCCLTASDQFSRLRLADLRSTPFWRAYRADARLDHRSANCQCDRKSVCINSAVSLHLNGRVSPHDHRTGQRHIVSGERRGITRLAHTRRSERQAYRTQCP